MGKARLTYHNGYRDKNGKAYNTKHNDRENFEKPKNADMNEYWDYQKWGTETFSESEKTFYIHAFSDFVKTHNEKCKKRGQYARCTTIEEYREKHPPEETLLYIGTKNVDSAKLKAVFDDFSDFLKQNCNNDTCGIELLNAALHTDETTPHIHFRKVYWYTDKDGNAQISQSKALAGLGFERPDKTKKEGRYNNAKVTFDRICREKLFEIAKNHGVELETEPLPKNEVGLPLDEYITRQHTRECVREETQKLKDDIQTLIHEKDNLIHETGDLNGFLAYKKGIREKEDEEKRKAQEEEAKREHEKALRERQEIAENLKRNIENIFSDNACSATCSPASDSDMGDSQKENVREHIRNASETPETVSEYPNTSKSQTRLKNAFKHMHDEDEDEHSNDKIIDLLSL